MSRRADAYKEYKKETACARHSLRVETCVTQASWPLTRRYQLLDTQTPSTTLEMRCIGNSEKASALHVQDRGESYDRRGELASTV